MAIGNKEFGPIKFTVEKIQNYPFHVNDNIKVLYILKGSLKLITVSGEIPLNEGDIEFINIGVPVKIQSVISDNLVITMEISRQYLLKLEPDLNPFTFFNTSTTLYFPSHNRHNNMQNLINNKWLKHSFINLFKEYRNNAQGYFNEKNIELFCRFFLENFQDTRKHLACFRQINEQQIQRFIRIEKYSLNNLDKKITLNDVAEMEYITPQYLSSEFRNKFNRTFSNILEYFRIVKASSLILKSDDKISRIAEECGFSDNKYFYRAFKMHMGCTPSEFRINLKHSGGIGTQFFDLHSPDVDELILKCVFHDELQINPHIEQLDLALTDLGTYEGAEYTFSGVTWNYCLFIKNSKVKLILESDEIWTYHMGAGLKVLSIENKEVKFLADRNSSEFLPAITLSSGTSVEIKLDSKSSDDYTLLSRIKLYPSA